VPVPIATMAASPFLILASWKLHWTLPPIDDESWHPENWPWGLPRRPFHNSSLFKHMSRPSGAVALAVQTTLRLWFLMIVDGW
jgi:hypothetical protein